MEPIYRKVMKQLAEQIARSRDGDAFPSEQAIGARFKVSRVTVRKALAILSDQGLLVRRRGQGTVVRKVTPPTRQLHVLVLIPGQPERLRFAYDILAGCFEQVRQSGTRLHTMPAATDPAEALAEARQCRADGIMLIVPSQQQDRILEAMRHQEQPVMLVNRIDRTGEFSYVSTDHAGGGEALTNVLLDRGHTRILFAFLAAAFPYTVERHAGFMAAQAKRGRPAPAGATVTIDVDESNPAHNTEIQNQLSAALDRFRPTALCCAGGHITSGIILPLLRRRGLKAGRDLEIATFDELPATDPEKPLIHEAVQTPWPEFGALAQWKLEAIIRGVSGRARVLLPPTLRIKDPRSAAGELKHAD